MAAKTNFWYGADSLSLSKLLDAGRKSSRKNIDRKFGTELTLARALLDASYQVACHYSWFMHAPDIARPNKSVMLTFAAFHKGLLTLSAALDLTSVGFYGPARPLLRNVYEFIVTAKFCCLAENEHVLQRWKDGETIYFTNAILKRIKSPDTTPLTELWNELNELTHATRTSAQISLDFESNVEEIAVNMALIRVLANWLAHLLTAQLISRSMRRATHKYYDNKALLVQDELYLADLLRISFAKHSKTSKRLITCFRRQWVIEANRVQ
jgi:hypothetical protein